MYGNNSSGILNNSPISRFFYWSYHDATPLMVFDGSHYVTTITSSRGVRQGCSVGAFAFALATIGAFTDAESYGGANGALNPLVNEDSKEEIKRGARPHHHDHPFEAERAHLVGLMDDVTVVGNHSQVFNILERLDYHCHMEHGLLYGMKMKPSKCSVQWRHSRGIPMAVVEACRKYKFPIKHAADGCERLGAYFGPRHYYSMSDGYSNDQAMVNMRAWASKKVQSYKRVFDMLKHEKISMQIAYAIMRKCVNSMIIYMMGTNPPRWLEHALEEWQSLIDDVMVSKFGFHHDELHDHPQSPMIWSSTRDGGLGFVDARQTAQRIWLTSAAYAAPDISAFINAKNQRSQYFTSLGIAWELIRTPIVTSPSYQRDVDPGIDISQPARINPSEQRASPLSRKIVHQLLSSSISEVIDRFSGSTVPHGFAKQLSHYQRLAGMDSFLEDHPRGDPVHERVIDCQNKVTSTLLNLPVDDPDFIIPDYTFKPYLRNRAGFAPHPQMSRGYTCGMCNTYVNHPDHHFQQCRPASSGRTDCHNIIANVLASAATSSGFTSHGEVVLSSIINRRVRTIQVRHKQQQSSISLSAIARDRIG
jgi:hypothetical protein